MHKKIAKSLLVLALILVAIFFSTSCPSNTSAVEQDTEFKVNVNEVLSINITTPASWASGSAGTFLRNKVTVGIASNNTQGFTASMITSDANAELKHSSKNTSISTLNSGTSYTCTNNTTCPEFPDNKWGYAIDYGANDSNIYYPMVGSNGSPISLISNAESTQQSPITSRDIYFSTKSDISQTSGTYSGTVVFYVVSGAVAASQDLEDLEASPESTPTTLPDSLASYSAPAAVTNDTDFTTSTSQGNTLDSYQDPAGVTNSSDIHDSSMLTTGLAIAASVAAVSGATLFAIAQSKKDGEEEQ